MSCPYNCDTTNLHRHFREFATDFRRIREQSGLPLALVTPFDIPHRSLRSKSAAPPRHGVRAVFLPLPGDGIPRKLIPGLIPIAQRITVPRLTNRKRG